MTTKSQSAEDVRLSRFQFEAKLKQAVPGDHFVIYSPGVSGWMRLTLGRVEWPYFYDDRGPDRQPMPVHISHIHKLETQKGEVHER